ncbi:MAG: zf-HC2 domain-containing protein [Planctomycetes bacterium]|nr:zf-HC2 domain-containing protein [Planctomycetota bacterium]
MMKLRTDTCQTVRDLLPLHVGNDLEPRRASQVDKHLERCTTCFREFRELASMRGLLGVLAEEQLPSGVLDGFAEEVMARIAIGERGPAAAPPRQATILRPFTWQRAAALAAGLLVAVSAWQVVSHDAAPVASPHLGVASIADADPVGTPDDDPSFGNLDFGRFDLGGVGVVAGGAGTSRVHGARQFVPQHLGPNAHLPSDVDRIVMDMAGSLGSQSLVGSGLMVDYDLDGSLRDPRPREP